MSQADTMTAPESPKSSAGELTAEVLYDKCMVLARNLWWAWHPEVINL